MTHRATTAALLVSITVLVSISSHAQQPELLGVIEGEPNTLLGWEIIGVGDQNDDGYDDFIRGDPLPFSGAGQVELYLGGPSADGEWDWRITNSQLDGLQYEVGRACTGIGDFNGDGIGDFAFAAEGGLGQRLVYIYAGWNDVTGVDYEYDPALPSDFTLSHNFPNPFNPTTTIQFSIPIRSATSLIIYNVLGQEVKQLIGGTLTAGSYEVIWNGTDQSGKAVSSGAYFYKLSAGEITHSRKMVLLK